MTTDVLTVPLSPFPSPLPVWIKRITASMELDVSKLTATDWYAIGLTSFLVLLALRRVIRIILHCICPPAFRIYRLPIFSRLGRRISQWAVRCLAYRGPFRRGSSVDILTWAHFLVFILYLTSNLSCTIIGAVDVAEACLRAGRLAFINLLILYVGPCLDFIASVLRLRLRVQRRIHASVGYVVAILSTVHAVGAFSRHGWSAVDQEYNLYAALVMSSLSVIAFLELTSNRLLSESASPSYLSGLSRHGFLMKCYCPFTTS